MQGWSRDQYFDADRAAVGAAVAEHPDARQRHRLSGHRAARGHERLGRPRHDAAVRARRRAVGRSRARSRQASTALGLPGVHFRPIAVRADVPQARRRRLRRLPDPRDRSRDVPARGETGVAIIDAFRRAGPDRFAWRDPPYEYEYTKPPIDILYGSAGLREGLAGGRTHSRSGGGDRGRTPRRSSTNAGAGCSIERG